MSDGAASTARCAEHFDVDSVAPCARCGRFCCAACLQEREPPVCTACAPALFDPYGLKSRGFEFGHALKTGFLLLGPELPRLLLVVVVVSLPISFLQAAVGTRGDDLAAVRTSTQLSALYDAFFGLLGGQAILALLIARAEGRVLTLGGALFEAGGNFGRAFGARLRSALWILAFMLLLVVPAFWKATLLMFALVAALRRQDRDALELSQTLVRGRFWLCFGYGVVAWGLTFGPMFVLLAAVSMLQELAGLPGLAAELAGDFIARFFSDVVLTSLLYVAFLMLHRDAGEVLEPMSWRRPLPVAGLQPQRGPVTLQGS